jgi:cytochrome c-type biogenesis protein CcmH/NrfG
MLLRRTPEDPFVRFTAVASFLGALYLFTLATVMLPSATLLVLAFVFAGIFISTTRYAARGHQWGVIFSRSPRLGFVIVFALTILLLSSIVAAYALAERYLAVVYLSQSVAALSAGSVDAADQAAQKSLSFAPSAGAYQVEIGVATSRLSTIAASSTMDAATAKQAYQTALSSGVAAGTAATAVAPGDYQSWVLLGGLYAQAVQVGVPGAYAKAQDAYSHAQALDPTDPQIPYAIAQLNLANKDTKGAEAALKQAVALKPDYTDAVFLLSQLQAQNGELKDALNSALQAAYFTPNNPSILFQIGVLYVAQGNLTDAAAAFTAAVQANSQFANARYLLAAIKAKQGDTSSAITELQAIAKLSSSNATALAPQIADLEAGKDPFPANLLTASSTPAQ